MKKFFILFGILLLVSNPVVSQTELEFRIYHNMGGQPFELDIPVSNNLGESFKVTRLQYYLTRISVIHDGGQITAASLDTMALVTPGLNHTSINLGWFDLTNVEGVSFHIGVYSPINNYDPSTYPPDHPLAPQNPSMHWGWAAGYRFLVYDGQSGTNYSQIFQLHAIGDHNYFGQTIMLDAQYDESKLVLAVDANYLEGLRDIELSNGIMAHGTDLEDQEALHNFLNHVFQARSAPLDLSASELQNDLTEVFPNPVQSGQSIYVRSNLEINKVEMYDLSGRMVSFSNSNSLDLGVADSGVYLLKVKSKTKEFTKPIVIQ